MTSKLQMDRIFVSLTLANRQRDLYIEDGRTLDMQMITLHIAMASLSGMLLFTIWKKWRSVKLKRIAGRPLTADTLRVEREAEIRAWMQRNGHR